MVEPHENRRVLTLPRLPRGPVAAALIGKAQSERDRRRTGRTTRVRGRVTGTAASTTARSAAAPGWSSCRSRSSPRSKPSTRRVRSSCCPRAAGGSTSAWRRARDPDRVLAAVRALRGCRPAGRRPLVRRRALGRRLRARRRRSGRARRHRSRDPAASPASWATRSPRPTSRFAEDRLEYPQYTRPGRVPRLVGARGAPSGAHERIVRWRRAAGAAAHHRAAARPHRQAPG